MTICTKKTKFPNKMLNFPKRKFVKKKTNFPQKKDKYSTKKRQIFQRKEINFQKNGKVLKNVLKKLPKNTKFKKNGKFSNQKWPIFKQKCQIFKKMNKF